MPGMLVDDGIANSVNRNVGFGGGGLKTLIDPEFWVGCIQRSDPIRAPSAHGSKHTVSSEPNSTATLFNS